jgi:CubicO group peptidase (beta-lactamase class C family)
MTRRDALASLGVSVLAGCAARGLGSGTAGPATAADAPAADALHALMAAYVERGDVPGLVTLVARRGQVSVDAIGTSAAAGAGRPVTRDAIFRVASMTKPVTAAAAMILVEDGKLRLDDPVDRWLPELAHRRVLRRLESPLDDTVPAARRITVRDLLTFTFGMGIVLAEPGTVPIQKAMDDLALGQGMPSPQGVPAPDEWIRRLGTLPLIHQPGERWMYNTGSDVLAVLIARVADRPFADFLHERLFVPLGMKDTGFAVSAADRERLMSSYVVDPKTGVMTLYDAPDGQWSRPPAFPAGGAGLVSTADDFFAFGDLLLQKGTRGGVRVLAEASVAAMTRDQLTPAQKAASSWFGLFEQHGWGFGMAVVTGRDDSGAPGAYGWDGGLGTSWRSDPTEGAVRILLTQRSWTSPQPPPVCRDFWKASRA